MRVLVAGANGSTGFRVVRRLLEGPHEPVAMIRDPDQRARFDELGAETAVADLEEPLGHAVEGCGGVIFCAGSGAETSLQKTRDVDRDGAIRLVDAAGAAGVGRFVMLSAMNADPDAEGGGMNVYYRCKGAADEHLRESGVDHTVVRPGRLTEEPGSGRIEVAPELDRSGTISRDDVAEVLVRSLTMPSLAGRTFDVLEGETPVARALERL